MQNIIHIVSNREWGGGEQYVLDLASRQRADGIGVTVVCKPVESIRRKYDEAGLHVLTMPLGGVLDVRSAIALAREVSRLSPPFPTRQRRAPLTVIHAHNFKDAFTACYARRLSRRSDVRVVMCRHLTRKGKNTLPYRWLYRELDCLCLDSEVSRREFLSTRPSIDPQKLRIVHTSIVVPQGVETVDVRGRFDIPADAVIAMFHGRLDPEKGLDALLEAMALLNGHLRGPQELRLVLVGRGSDEYTAHLVQKAAELGITGSVVFAGFQHPVLPWVAAADVGVLASTVSEGCPLSPMEYMSQGRPVVVTNNGGQCEYVADGSNGLLVTPGDVEALARALSSLAADPALRQRLGHQARADFDDHLSYDHFYQQINAIYQ